MIYIKSLKECIIFNYNKTLLHLLSQIYYKKINKINNINRIHTFQDDQNYQNRGPIIIQIITK